MWSRHSIKKTSCKDREQKQKIDRNDLYMLNQSIIFIKNTVYHINERFIEEHPGEFENRPGTGRIVYSSRS